MQSFKPLRPDLDQLQPKSENIIVSQAVMNFYFYFYHSVQYIIVTPQWGIADTQIKSLSEPRAVKCFSFRFLSVYVSVCLSLSVSVSLSVCFVSVCLCLSLSVFLCLCLCLCLCLSACLSHALSLSVFLFDKRASSRDNPEWYVWCAVNTRCYTYLDNAIC